jgi:hypothetical protein
LAIVAVVVIDLARNVSRQTERKGTKAPGQADTAQVPEETAESADEHERHSAAEGPVQLEHDLSHERQEPDEAS